MKVSIASRKFGKLITRLILITIGSIVGVLLAEWLTRLLFPQLAPRTARITKFWKQDPVLGWSHNPGVSGNFETFGVNTFVTINSKGFRGKSIEYARDQNHNRQRMLVLGDSYVWGYGVNDNEIFTERLGEAMPKVEIVNAGVSGYSTDQELLMYRNECHKYNADLVIIVVSENDALGNLIKEQYVIYWKPAFQLKDGTLTLMQQPVAGSPSWKRVVAQYAMRSYLLTAVNRYLYSKTIEKIEAPSSQIYAGEADSRVNQITGKFPVTRGEEITSRLLIELGREISARQSGGKLLVVFTEDMTRSQEMAEYLKGFDISCLDLEKHVNGGDRSLYLPDDFHWNAEGHKRVADILGGQLGKYLN